jgi:hypothetical protein
MSSSEGLPQRAHGQSGWLPPFGCAERLHALRTGICFEMSFASSYFILKTRLDVCNHPRRSRASPLVINVSAVPATRAAPRLIAKPNALADDEALRYAIVSFVETIRKN